MIFKLLKLSAIVYVTVIVGCLLFFDRDQEQLKWQLDKANSLSKQSITDFQSWTMFNVQKNDSSLISTSNDPFIISPDWMHSGAKKTYIKIDMETTDKLIQVFWKKNDQQFSEDKSKVFREGESVELLIEEDISQIRIDPAGSINQAFKILKVEVEKYQ